MEAIEPKHLLIVDNHDSFVYNLVQMVEENGHCMYDIVRNDCIIPEYITGYKGILLSPGPGLPGEAGKLCRLIEETYRHTPILGICLGHQAIAEVFGAQGSFFNNSFNQAYNFPDRTPETQNILHVHYS